MEYEEGEDDDYNEEELEDPEGEPIEEVFESGSISLGTKERKGSDRIAAPHLGRLAKSKLLSIRAKQLSIGRLSVIPLSRLRSRDFRQIALQEIEERVIPLKVKRQFPDGWYEIWEIKDFESIAKD